VSVFPEEHPHNNSIHVIGCSSLASPGYSQPPAETPINLERQKSQAFHAFH